MSVASPVINNIDHTTKRIYLKVGIVAYHPIDDIYHEVRNLRRTVESERKYDVPVQAGGRVPKGGGKFTPRYAIFNNGYKIIPQDADHTLAVTGEQLTDDGQAGTTIVDLTPLSAGVKVKVDYTPSEAEVIEVSTGSGVTAQDILDIAAAVWNHVKALTIGKFFSVKNL